MRKVIIGPVYRGSERSSQNRPCLQGFWKVRPRKPENPLTYELLDV